MTRKFVGSLLLLLGFTGISFTGISASAASAQSLNQRAIRQQLQHKILLLRGRYLCPDPGSCTLTFNQKGQIQSPAITGPFSLSAIYVDQMKFKRRTLLLDAHRATLLRLTAAQPPQIRGLELDHQKLQIRIPIDMSQPLELQAALHAIFVGAAEQALSAESPKMRKADLASLPLLTPEPKAKVKRKMVELGPSGEHAIADLRKSGVTAPKPIHLTYPSYTNQARLDKVEGTCELNFIVSAQGIPQDIRVVKSLPDDLDESAIAAVSQYRFKPAMWKGKPVAVRIVIDVGFHLF